MTVGLLKKYIKDLPDTTNVLVPGNDHSFREAQAHQTTALFSENAGWTEDYGEKITPQRSYGKRKTIVLIS